MAIVLIIGASRGIGLETVMAALEAGHSVRALARSARRIPVDHPKLKKMAGDALEMATVKRALTGVDVVIQSLGRFGRARNHPQADAAQTALVTLGASDHQQDRCTVRHALRHHGRRPGRGDRDRKASNCRRVPARRHARTAAVSFSRLLQIIGAQC